MFTDIEQSNPHRQLSQWAYGDDPSGAPPSESILRLGGTVGPRETEDLPTWSETTLEACGSVRGMSAVGDDAGITRLCVPDRDVTKHRRGKESTVGAECQS
jgi:hypothetical protein